MGAESTAFGRMTAGQYDRYFLPRINKDSPPLVFMTGGGGTALDDTTSATHIVDAALALGYKVVMPSVPNLAGNATADARIDAAINYARTQLGANAQPPVLMGVSNGANCSLLYAVNHPTKAVVGVLPPVDIQYIYVNNVMGFRTTIIEPAWGIVYPQPLPVEASASLNTAALSFVPQQLWYATDDAVSTNIVPYAAATLADLRSVGALGHTDAAVLAVQAAQVSRFLQKFIS